MQHSIEKVTEEKVGVAVRDQTMDATGEFKVHAKQALAQIENVRDLVEGKRNVVVKSPEFVNGEVTKMVQATVTTSSSNNEPQSLGITEQKAESSESVFGKLPERMVAIASSRYGEVSFEDGSGGVFSTRFLRQG